MLLPREVARGSTLQAESYSASQRLLLSFDKQPVTILASDGNDDNFSRRFVHLVEHTILSHPKLPVSKGRFSERFPVSRGHGRLMDKLGLDFIQNAATVPGR